MLTSEDKRNILVYSGTPGDSRMAFDERRHYNDCIAVKEISKEAELWAFLNKCANHALSSGDQDGLVIKIAEKRNAVQTPRFESMFSFEL